MSKGGGPDKVVDFRSFGERPARGLATSLYIGSKADAKAEKLLRERGVKFVLNCTPTRNLDPEAGCPNFFEGRTPPPFTYKRIPIFDNRGEDILQYMEGAISFIEQSKHYGSVLVHCNKGVSRSASFVIGYLMKTGGLRLEAALAFLKEKRGIVQPNDSFMTQLQTYDARLEAQRTEARAKHERMYGTSTAKASTGTGAGAPAPGPMSAATRPTAGAIGPALPPHLQKKAEESTAGGSPSPAAPRAIGPALPPHLQQKKPASSAGPIGPSLPPSPTPPGSKGDLTTKERAEEQGREEKKRPAIGPAMPPGMAAQGAEKDEREGKRAKV